MKTFSKRSAQNTILSADRMKLYRSSQILQVLSSSSDIAEELWEIPVYLAETRVRFVPLAVTLRDSDNARVRQPKLRGSRKSALRIEAPAVSGASLAAR